MNSIDNNLKQKLIDGHIADGFAKTEAEIAVNEIVEARPEARSDFTKTIAKKVYTKDGIHEGLVQITYNGTPEFNVVEGHEMDSRWMHKVKGLIYLSLPKRENWISQAEYIGSR